MRKSLTGQNEFAATNVSPRSRFLFWLRIAGVLLLLSCSIAIAPGLRILKERYLIGVLTENDIPFQLAKLRTRSLETDDSPFLNKIGSFRMIAWLTNFYRDRPVITSIDLNAEDSSYPENLAIATSLNHLDELTLRRLRKESSFAPINACPKLRKLILAYCKINANDIRSLSEIESLRYLCILRDCTLTPDAVDELRRLKQLEWLIVSCEAEDLDSVRIDLPNCYVSR